MNTRQAQDVVLLEAVGIGVITVLGSLGSGKGLPKAPTYAAVGLLGAGLMVLARVNARFAVMLGGIAVAGAALASYTSGKSLAEAAFDQVQKIGRAGSPASGETASDRFSKIGSVSGNVGSSVERNVVESAPGEVMGGGGRPVNGSYRIIGRPYGGTHTLGNWQSDNALDIAMPVGTPIYAIADGKIGSRIGALNSSNPRLAGLRVNLEHKGGGASYYAHLSRLVVEAGDEVKRGQLLGYSGTANGVPHLHFAVQPPANPSTYYGG